MMNSSMFGRVQQQRITWVVLLLFFAIAASLICGWILPDMVNEKGRVALSRFILLCLSIQLIAIGFSHQSIVNKILHNFFYATAHPVNLAVFRIFFFWILFEAVDPSKIILFSQLPVELQFAPKGMGLVLDYLPINTTLAGIASTLLRVFCLTGMIGLFTRTSAWLAVILGFYALGIPQFYGKVNHYHHLLWFAAILASSRCADVLSCDAVFAAWRRADRGQITPPTPSRLYALPLRFVWLLIGLIYFFPGFRKVWRSGLDWALSDNFKFQLYSKWMELDGWTPFFRLDHHPWLYRPLALGAIAFELSFIFLILIPRWRILAIASGLMFHEMVGLFMRIYFRTLQYCYVAFVDWSGVFQRLGQWLYPTTLYALYDGSRVSHRRAIAVLQTLDILGRITYLDGRDRELLAQYHLDSLPSDASLAEVQTLTSKQHQSGLAAYRALVSRIPLLWPLVPVLYVSSKVNKGNSKANKGDRDLSSPMPVNGQSTASSSAAIAPRPNSKSARKLRPVILTGTLLLVVNTLFGFAGWEAAWPFACYPTFQSMAGAQTKTLEIVALDAAGNFIPVEQQALAQHLSPPRLRGLIGRIFSGDQDPVKRQQKLMALWKISTRQVPELQQARSVQFYRVTLWTPPDRQHENPAKRDLLFELQL